MRTKLSPSVWVFLAYFVGIWWYSVPFTGDEKLYVSTAMEMLLNRDWLHSSLFGVHSYYKPPFQYWTILLSWSSFGFNNLSTYLPSALATAGTAWGLERISRGLSSKGLRIYLAGVWFAACTGTLTYGTTAQMEIWTVWFYVMGWWALLEYLKTEKWGWFYLALGLAGASGLVKSPIYSVFAVLGFWLLLVLRKKTKIIAQFHFYGAHLFGVGVGVVWYLFILKTDYTAFWGQYVQYETLSKMGGNRSSLVKLWTDFSLLCIPFLLLLIPAIRGLRRANYSLLSFCFAYAFLPTLFFSTFPYKTETYLYILTPLLGLILDQGLNAKSKFDLYLSRVNGGFIFFLACFAALIFTVSGIIPLYLGVGMGLAATAFLVYSVQARWAGIAYSSLILIFLLRLGGLSLGENDIADLRHVVETHPGRKVTFYNPGFNVWHETGILSAALGQPSGTAFSPEDAAQALQRGEIVVIADFLLEDQSKIETIVSKVKSSSVPLTALIWLRWKRNFQIPTGADLFHMADRFSAEWQSRNKREYRILFF